MEAMGAGAVCPGFGHRVTAQGGLLPTSQGLRSPSVNGRLNRLDDPLVAAVRAASLVPMDSHLCHLSLPCLLYPVGLTQVAESLNFPN